MDRRERLRAMLESDERLLARCRRGDTLAFDELFRRYRAKVFSFIMQFVKDRAVAEDLFQETFLRMYRKAKYFQARSKFSTWLYTIAANLCRDELKRAQRKQKVSLDRPIERQASQGGVLTVGEVIADAGASPSEEASAAEMRRLLAEAIERLPEELRSVVVLHGVHRLKYREVAKLLRCPIGTVQSRMHHAVQLLKQHFDRYREPNA